MREAQQGLGRLREAGPGRAPTASRAVRGLGEHACCLPLCLVRPHQGVKPVRGRGAVPLVGFGPAEAALRFGVETTVREVGSGWRSVHWVKGLSPAS